MLSQILRLHSWKVPWWPYNSCDGFTRLTRNEWHRNLTLECTESRIQFLHELFGLCIYKIFMTFVLHMLQYKWSLWDKHIKLQYKHKHIKLDRFFIGKKEEKNMWQGKVCKRHTFNISQLTNVQRTKCRKKKVQAHIASPASELLQEHCCEPWYLQNLAKQPASHATWPSISQRQW